MIVNLKELEIYAKPAFYGKDWNGFRSPFFTLAQCHEIVRAINERLGENAYSLFENGEDLFLYESADDISGEVQHIEREGVIYYALGGDSWTWTECTETTEKII